MPPRDSQGFLLCLRLLHHHHHQELDTVLSSIDFLSKTAAHSSAGALVAEAVSEVAGVSPPASCLWFSHTCSGIQMCWQRAGLNPIRDLSSQQLPYPIRDLSSQQLPYQ